MCCTSNPYFSMSVQKLLLYRNRPLFQKLKITNNLPIYNSTRNINKFNRILFSPVKGSALLYHSWINLHKPYVIKSFPSNDYHQRLIVRSSSSSKDQGSRSGREELQHAYHALLKRLTDLEDATRFYGYSAIRVGLVLASLIGIWLYLFRDYIRENVAGQVSTVATKSLGDEELQMKAQELAVALLYTIFNDDNMQQQTVKFLQDILHKPATQKALIDLMVIVFSEENTQQNLIWLLKNVLMKCLDDENFRIYLSERLMLLLTDENTKKGLKDVLASILHDKQVIDSAQLFVQEVVASERVHTEATRLSKSVVEGVVKDHTIQKQTGEAIWSAVGYSVTPRWFVKGNQTGVPLELENTAENIHKNDSDNNGK